MKRSKHKAQFPVQQTLGEQGKGQPPSPRGACQKKQLLRPLWKEHEQWQHQTTRCEFILYISLFIKVQEINVT